MTEIVTLTIDQLRTIVREEVERAVEPLRSKTIDGESEVLTRVQVAQLLRINPHGVPRLIREGMPAVRWGKKEWRFRRSEVLAWISSRQQKGAA